MQPICVLIKTMSNPISPIEQLLEDLARQGFKRTKVRRALIAHLQFLKKPVDAANIRSQLETEGLTVNKSTIYRELEFLLARGIIIEIHFGDGKKRYEIVGLPHHHHAVCKKCQRIEDIFLDHDLIRVEERIRKEKSFLVHTHNLEFFGLCRDCSKS